jgi:hypothetical protein
LRGRARRAQKASGRGQIERDAETGGHGDAARNDQATDDRRQRVEGRGSRLENAVILDTRHQKEGVRNKR